MKTQITYDVPDAILDSILAQLGYTESTNISKEEFMNEAIKKVVLPAIADVFINAKQAEIVKTANEMPAKVHASVAQMLSITTA